MFIRYNSRTLSTLLRSIRLNSSVDLKEGKRPLTVLKANFKKHGKLSTCQENNMSQKLSLYCQDLKLKNMKVTINGHFILSLH